MGKEDAISKKAKKGFDLFKGKAACVVCHDGFNFTDGSFHNLGIHDEELKGKELGRYNVKNRGAWYGVFKTPTLRDVALTAPYMHDGRFETLEEVIEHYNSGLNASSTIDPALVQTMGTGLRLDSTDKADLVAFLKTLTDHYLLENPEYSSPF